MPPQALLLVLHLGLDTHESLVADMQEFLVHLTDSEAKPSLRGAPWALSPQIALSYSGPFLFCQVFFPVPYLPFPIFTFP